LSQYLFYRLGASEPSLCAARLAPGYEIQTWHPGRDGPPGAVLPRWPYIVWWLFDRLLVFSNPHAGVLMIRYRDHVVHRSLVTPRWFRFPEMGRNDLQIGDTWTDPEHRGKGLAKAALAAIHEHWAGKYDQMWYLVGEDNVASVRVIETCGYRLVGRGKRTRPIWLGILGRFVITSANQEAQTPGE
jgi:RimJ/RimL family protein N-acetyltransferase